MKTNQICFIFKLIKRRHLKDHLNTTRPGNSEFPNLAEYF